MSATFEHQPIATVQRYWDARPCNIRHSPQPVGSREYFDEVEARKYFVEPHIPRFADHTAWAGKRILEIGCGIGTDTINFARAGAHITAVDLSGESLAVAKRRAEVFGVADRIDFVQGNAEELDTAVPPQRYDLVYSFGVLHHTPRPDRAFDQIKRYVAPGSTIKVMVYYRYSWKVFALALRHGGFAPWQLTRIVAQHSEAQLGCPVTYTYSRNELGRMLQSRGWTVTDMFVDHIFRFRIPDYVQYRYREAWPFRAVPMPLFRALERRLGWHLCATARVS